MDATTYDRRDEAWEHYNAPHDEQPLPRRPRRQYFNKRSAALIAVLTCAAGFYAGVRVEKGQVGNSSAITLPGATGGATGRTGAAGSRGGGSGFAGLFSGGGGASGTSLGTISGVKGNTLYVTDTTGNVTKVKLSSATKITKSLDVKRGSLHPGDSVVIRGLKNSSGTLVAASVSDSGTGAGGLGGLGALGGAGGGGGATGGGSSSSGSSGSGSSSVSSLFSSGGSGG